MSASAGACTWMARRALCWPGRAFSARRTPQLDPHMCVRMPWGRTRTGESRAPCKPQGARASTRPACACPARPQRPRPHPCGRVQVKEHVRAVVGDARRARQQDREVLRRLGLLGGLVNQVRHRVEVGTRRHLCGCGKAWERGEARSGAGNSRRGRHAQQGGRGKPRVARVLLARIWERSTVACHQRCDALAARAAPTHHGASVAPGCRPRRRSRHAGNGLRAAPSRHCRHRLGG